MLTPWRQRRNLCGKQDTPNGICANLRNLRENKKHPNGFCGICRAWARSVGLALPRTGICANLRNLRENKKHPERLRARHT